MGGLGLDKNCFIGEPLRKKEGFFLRCFSNTHSSLFWPIREACSEAGLKSVATVTVDALLQLLMLNFLNSLRLLKWKALNLPAVQWLSFTDMPGMAMKLSPAKYHKSIVRHHPRIPQIESLINSNPRVPCHKCLQKSEDGDVTRRTLQHVTGRFTSHPLQSAY